MIDRTPSDNCAQKKWQIVLTYPTQEPSVNKYFYDAIAVCSEGQKQPGRKQVHRNKCFFYAYTAHE